MQDEIWKHLIAPIFLFGVLITLRRAMPKLILSHRNYMRFGIQLHCLPYHRFHSSSHVAFAFSSRYGQDWKYAVSVIAAPNP